VWLFGPAVGATPLWGLPAFVAGLLLAGFVGQRRKRGASQRSSRGLTRNPILFHILLGALGWGALGVAFAVSEGDIPPGLAASRFGAIGAGLGLLVGLVVRVKRAAAARRGG